MSLTSLTDTDCETSLESNIKFSDVECEVTMIDSKTYQIDITFIKFPTQPYENNLYTHNGNPLITDFLCDMTQTDSDVKCYFSDAVTSNLIGILLCMIYML
jgi:hypothetical protein